jgi:hypothetical protein
MNTNTNTIKELKMAIIKSYKSIPLLNTATNSGIKLLINPITAHPIYVLEFELYLDDKEDFVDFEHFAGDFLL